MASEDSADLPPVELAINGELDLHTFRPSELAPLVTDYIDECRKRGILSLRIIHGKGQGVLRTIVHGILDGHPHVESFGHPSDGGSWGATVARLRI